MKRKCDCSGGCGPQGGDVSRREFMEVVAIGAAGATLASKAAAAELSPQQAAEEFDRWKTALHAPSPPRVYRSDTHTDARLHLGGIGTGNVEIGVDGQLTTWQLFNTLRDGHVPFAFGVRAGCTPFDASRGRRVAGFGSRRLDPSHRTSERCPGPGFNVLPLKRSRG
jgi:hypothetical protein